MSRFKYKILVRLLYVIFLQDLKKKKTLGRMRTPVREAFSYGIWHGIRHIHCNSMSIRSYIPYENALKMPENASRTGVRILPIVGDRPPPAMSL